MGEQVEPVRVSRGWEDRGSPWCFRGAGTACKGEQGLAGQGGALVPWVSRYSL